MWPMYMKEQARSSHNPLAVHWAPVIFTDTTLLYSALFAFSRFREHLLAHRQDTNEQPLYLKLAFSNLRLTLSEHEHVENSRSIDSLILSTLSLVPSETLTSDTTNRMKVDTWMPPWHALYARTSSSNPHVRAAFELVRLRGGIEKLELFGLQRLIA